MKYEEIMDASRGDNAEDGGGGRMHEEDDAATTKKDTSVTFWAERKKILSYI